MKLIEIKAISEEKIKTKIDEIMLNKDKKADDYFNLGLLNLSLGIYDGASLNFKKAIELEFDYADSYYYLAISYLKGNLFSNCNDTLIIKIEELLNGAIMLEKKFKYYLFLAFLNYDYYYRIGLKVWGGYEKYIEEAKKIGFSEEDLSNFLKELNRENDEFRSVVLNS